MVEEDLVESRSIDLERRAQPLAFIAGRPGFGGSGRDWDRVDEDLP